MVKTRAGRRPRKHRGVKVLELADGRHVARWVDPLSGRQQQQSLDALGYTNDTARRTWARQKSEQVMALRRAITTGTVVAQRASVADAVAEYLGGVPHEPTRRSKSNVLDAFAEWARGQIPTLAELSGPVLMRWRDRVLLPSNKREQSTKANWLAITATFLRHAMRRGLTPLLGVEAITMATERPAVPAKAIEILQPQQVREMLAAAIEHDKIERPAVGPFLLAMLLTGCRREEMIGLRWSEVKDDAIELPAERVKTRRSRTITFAEAPSLGLLFQRMREHATGEMVWQVTRHRLDWRIDMLSRPVGARGRQRGFGSPQFTPHTLRRTCGSVLANAPGIYAGASAYRAARRLGHNVAVAERSYLGAIRNLPADATTIEMALGIAPLCMEIIKNATGTVRS